jgi:hypothetical protein
MPDVKSNQDSLLPFITARKLNNFCFTHFTEDCCLICYTGFCFVLNLVLAAATSCSVLISLHTGLSVKFNVVQPPPTLVLNFDERMERNEGTALWESQCTE